MPATSPTNLAALTPATPWISRRLAAPVRVRSSSSDSSASMHRQFAYPGDQVGGDPVHNRVHEAEPLLGQA